MPGLYAFITGITGQDGSYLAELLLDKGYIVYGGIRRSSSFNTGRIDHLRDNPNILLRYMDMTDIMSISTILREIWINNPDKLEIYNLAAQSHVKVSFDVPIYTANVDALGTLNLLEAIRETNKLEQTRIYQASTSELYGEVFEVPQNEKTPFNPRSPYAIAKLYSYYITKNYREAYGMYISNGILFNHESPRRGENFVTRKITLELGKLKKGEIDCIYMGNLESKRDWGHAKDYVEGMWRILQYYIPEDFVLATGRQYSVKEFIERAFLVIDLKIKWRYNKDKEEGYIIENGKERVVVRVNPKYYRPTDVNTLLGDPSKASKKLGWVSNTPFDQLVREMVLNDL